MKLFLTVTVSGWTTFNIPRAIWSPFDNNDFVDVGDASSFDFFRQETSNIDPVVRSNAMGKATIICALMGADKARNELIPYLKSEFFVELSSKRS